MDLKLDYTGMTPEQIEEFINSTSITYEVDAMVTLNATVQGQMVDGDVQTNEATGWLSGTVLNVDINDNYGVTAVDMMIYALDAFKQAEYDMDEAFTLLVADKVPSLAQHI